MDSPRVEILDTECSGDIIVDSRAKNCIATIAYTDAERIEFYNSYYVPTVLSYAQLYLYDMRTDVVRFGSQESTARAYKSWSITPTMMDTDGFEYVRIN